MKFTVTNNTLSEIHIVLSEQKWPKEISERLKLVMIDVEWNMISLHKSKVINVRHKIVRSKKSEKVRRDKFKTNVQLVKPPLTSQIRIVNVRQLAANYALLHDPFGHVSGWNNGNCALKVKRLNGVAWYATESINLR